jgi:hypothetical protein
MFSKETVSFFCLMVILSSASPKEVGQRNELSFIQRWAEKNNFLQIM